MLNSTELLFTDKKNAQEFPERFFCCAGILKRFAGFPGTDDAKQRTPARIDCAALYPHRAHGSEITTGKTCVGHTLRSNTLWQNTPLFRLCTRLRRTKGGIQKPTFLPLFLRKEVFSYHKNHLPLSEKKGLFFVFDDAAADEVVLAADSQEQGKDAFSAGDDRNFTA